MNPWSHDAGQLNVDEIPNAYIFKNDTISRYLDPTAHDRQLFLVGPKGCGKTLLLRYKAYLYWKKQQSDPSAGYAVSASKDLVESLKFSLNHLSRSDLDQLSKVESWDKIWNFSLALLILKKSEIGVPEEFRKVFDRFRYFNGLSSIVTEILNNLQVYLNSNYFNYTNTLTSILRSELTHGFVLFVDRLDQELLKFLTSTGYNYSLQGVEENQPFRIWQNAQYALLEACYDFSTSVNRHIKIFATAREEALDVQLENTANIHSFSAILNYTKEELKIIFENNIRNTPGKYLRGNKSDSPWMRFFGFERVEHLKAKHADGGIQDEHVFSLLVRHTFERPREIIRLGKAIYDNIISRDPHAVVNNDYIESIRHAVNETAHQKILGGYLNEFIPYFRDDYFSNILPQFKCNLIPQEDIKHIDGDAINYLYRIGLIGYAQKGKQVFDPSSKYVYSVGRKLPVRDYYLLHPTIDRKMQEHHDYDDFLNAYNIVGNRRDFRPPDIFESEIEHDMPLEYYVPDKIPGRANDGKITKIVPSRNEMYNKLYLREHDPDWQKVVHESIRKSFKVLTLTSNYWCARKVEDAFEKDLSAYIRQLEQHLASLRGRVDYTARIATSDKNGMQMFIARNFGRVVAAGLLINLNIDAIDVRYLLTNFSFPYRQRKINYEHAVRFLRTAFFLCGLTYREMEATDKSKLRDGLSPFERRYLERWFSNYKNHTLMVNGQFNDGEKKYLLQQLNRFSTD